MLLPFSIASNAKILPSANIFIVPVIHIPQKIDPHLGNDIDLNQISMQIFEGLARFDGTGVPTPNLANWKLDTQRKSITFELKKNHFSDNSHVTSLDIYKSLKRSVGLGSPLAYQLSDIAKCHSADRCPVFRILSDNIFEINEVLNAKKLLQSLASMEGAIMKENIKLIGTAPFILKSISNSEIKIIRKVDSPNLVNTIVFRLTPSDKAEELYAQNKLSIINSVQFPILKEPTGTDFPIVYMGTTHIAFNFRSPIFETKENRLAVWNSINRLKLASALGANSTPATTFMTRGVLGSQSELNNTKIIKINKSIQTVTIALSTKFKSFSKFETELRTMLSAAGFKSKFRYLAFPEALKMIRENKADMMIKGDGVQNMEPATLYASLVSDSNSNISGYHDLQFDNLVKLATEANDDSVKLEYIQKIENKIGEAALVVPLAYIKYQRWIHDEFVIPNIQAQTLLPWVYNYSNITIKKENTHERTN